eukprot:4514033-Pyramimonas_sp.AAC.1
MCIRDRVFEDTPRPPTTRAALVWGAGSESLRIRRTSKARQMCPPRFAVPVASISALHITGAQWSQDAAAHLIHRGSVSLCTQSVS